MNNFFLNNKIISKFQFLLENYKYKKKGFKQRNYHKFQGGKFVFISLIFSNDSKLAANNLSV